MTLSTTHLLRTIKTLEEALKAIHNVSDENSIEFDLYRNAAIKSFELSLETTGKLLRKTLKAFSGSPRSTDRLVFNDVLRHAFKHDLLSEEEIERWLAYRMNRNNTAHDYGEGFANDTLKILPNFIQDAQRLAMKMQDIFDGRS